MNVPTSPRVTRRRGLSLLELTVVIATAFALVTVLFVGARSWKRSSDRASCILNLHNVQLAVRSYQNMYGYQYGGQPHATYGTQDIAVHLHEKGFIASRGLEHALGSCPCPGGGTYSVSQPEFFPKPGVLYMGCSHGHSHGHLPSRADKW